MQLRLREIDPLCIQCRNPWPGPAADSQLYSACQREGIPFQNTWAPLPQQQESGICDGTPAPPERVVALCCERLSALDTPVHPRQMEWSANRILEINAQGCRVHVGWEGEWGCNLCGRTVSQSDPRIRDAEAMQPHCPSDGPQTLMFGLLQGHKQLGMLASMHTLLLVFWSRDAWSSASTISSQPPACDNGTTNSFVYCPATGLLQQDCAMGWCPAVHWFEALCRRLILELYDVSHLAQALAEPLEISGTLPNAQEATAVAQMRHLSAQHPPGSCLGLRCIIPSILDKQGHVPNMLQDLLLQIFASLQLASELDTAVSSFRCQGTRPNLLQSLLLPMPVNPPDTHTMEPAVEAPDNNESCRSLVQTFDPLHLFPTCLHQHACVQRRSAQCGSRRRCRICSSQIPHQTI